jgi:hypothetical protein
VTKLHGNGPAQVKVQMVKEFLKYNSGARSFKPIATKSFTVQSDAVTLKLMSRKARVTGRGGL